MSDFYARAGEQVTCENGHHVATFLRDVKRGDRLGCDVELVDGSLPVSGGPIPVCNACGASAFKMMPTKAHFVDGWR